MQSFGVLPDEERSEFASPTLVCPVEESAHAAAHATERKKKKPKQRARLEVSILFLDARSRPFASPRRVIGRSGRGHTLAHQAFGCGATHTPVTGATSLPSRNDAGR